MNMKRLALMGALTLGACVANDTGDARTADRGTAAISAAAPATPATPAPITGRIHDVRMLGDNSGYRYEPANLRIRQGDGVRWIMVSGAPHNVAFDAAKLPPAVQRQLAANMPNQTSLASPMMLNANDSYTISFADIEPGGYDYHCTPHLTMGMTGRITVQ